MPYKLKSAAGPMPAPSRRPRQGPRLDDGPETGVCAIKPRCPRTIRRRSRPPPSTPRRRRRAGSSPWPSRGLPPVPGSCWSPARRAAGVRRADRGGDTPQLRRTAGPGKVQPASSSQLRAYDCSAGPASGRPTPDEWARRSREPRRPKPSRTGPHGTHGRPSFHIGPRYACGAPSPDGGKGKMIWPFVPFSPRLDAR